MKFGELSLPQLPMFYFANRLLRNPFQGFAGELHARVILFYVSLSPVFLAPILFIYLENELGVNVKTVLEVSALCAFATLLLDIPLGVIADRFGAKSTLFVGLVCYIVGITSLVVLPCPHSYYLYFFLTAIGYPCTSGADIDLIRQQIQDGEGSTLKRYLYYLQKWSYLVYAIFYLLTAALYTWDKRLPFFMQISLLCLSILNLRGMREVRGKLRPRKRKLFRDFSLCIRLCTLNRKYLLLVVCSSVFNLGISINHKVIQHQLMPYIAPSKLMAMGLIYATASLCSALGTTALAEGLRKFTLTRQVLALLGMLILSFAAMGIQQFLPIVGGFFLINLFKGGFRPLLNAELANQMPFQRLTAQTLSIASCASALLANAMQWVLSFRYVDAARGNMLYAAVAASLVVIALVYANFLYTWTIYERKGRMGVKRNALICTNGRFRFLQYYPQGAKIDHFRHLKWINALTVYPTPSFTWHFDAKEICVEMPFLGDVKLSDLKDPQKQMHHCKALLTEFRCCCGPSHLAKVTKAAKIFTPETLGQLQKHAKLCRECVIHGSLEPKHVIVLNAKCFVIDWNASGRGPWWWDVLMLLTHPHLYLSLGERLELFRQFAGPGNALGLKEIFTQFCLFRGHQLVHGEVENPRAVELSKRYLRLAES